MGKLNRYRLRRRWSRLRWLLWAPAALGAALAAGRWLPPGAVLRGMAAAGLLLCGKKVF